MSSKTESKEFSLKQIINYHLSNESFRVGNEQHELEVRFGTKGPKRISKIDFEQVVKKLKSLDFMAINPLGDYTLKIQNEFTDAKTGRTKLSNLRTEISGIHSIQKYCNTNSLENIDSISFLMKSFAKYSDDTTIFPINQSNYNLRISYQKEKRLNPKSPIVRQLYRDWDNSKKNFRYINRVSFLHTDFPVQIDLSIVKSNKPGNLSYNIKEAGVFSNPESYEIEIELNNHKVGPGSLYTLQNSDKLEAILKRTIKYILSGLQNTNYPIPYSEQDSVLRSYYDLIHGKNKSTDKKFFLGRDFIGPSSYTLELKNIGPTPTTTSDEVSIIPNIRDNYTVTDKADGIRKLCYVNDKGKIFFITTNMKVEFTGLKTTSDDIKNSILDGEHILHNKEGGYINLYAAFDIYYINGKSIREKGFVPLRKEDEQNNFRLPLLNQWIQGLNNAIESITKNQITFGFEAKNFYIGTSTNPIFNGCNTILQKEKDGLFRYETDGLIFTPAEFGVGANKSGEASIPFKVTWDYSFKWKPAKFNTIDFLVSIKKDSNNEEIIGNVFKNGLDTKITDQLLQYKTMLLRCGFDEAKHGILNPCNDIYEDKISSKSQKDLDDNKGYKPVLFYPTNPYDNSAHECKYILQLDKGGNKQLICENGDIIENNMIVEFRYNLEEEKGENSGEYNKWIPLRGRFDKTAELRAGQKNFGNAYHVANSNWHSIHHPVTSEMISTGKNIPELEDEDVYYNRKSKQTNTRGLRDFHNLVVKRKLITSVGKKGDILIDLSVGKAGDLSKWTATGLSFVFGIDISRDNIENKLDGACARYIKYKKQHKNAPDALFVNGNSSLNIRNGDAIFTEKGKLITKSIFGEIPKNPSLGKGVLKEYGKGTKGFNISSCQFSLHYFFENINTFEGFLRNVAECTELDGYFIGSCYDGQKIFNLLKDTEKGDEEPNESLVLTCGKNKICEIIKNYISDSFEEDSSSLGYAINVYQESINKYFKEYLVNFPFLTRSLENYGFRPLTKDEAAEFNLPSSIGSFKELYTMTETEAKMKNNSHNFGDAFKMSPHEKTLSFLNNYFVYKKIRAVDASKISLDKYEDMLDKKDTQELQESLESLKQTEPPKLEPEPAPAPKLEEKPKKKRKRKLKLVK